MGIRRICHAVNAQARPILWHHGFAESPIERLRSAHIAKAAKTCKSIIRAENESNFHCRSVLNEAAGSPARSRALEPLRDRGNEVIAWTDGSEDGTPGFRAQWRGSGDCAPRGPAAQMNAGARSRGERCAVSCMPDTRLPADAEPAFSTGSRRAAGRWDVRRAHDGRGALLPAVAFCMSLRSRLTGTPPETRHVRPARRVRAGGRLPGNRLMEDIALSRP